MTDGSPPTIGKLRRRGVKRLEVACQNCRHTAVLDVSELAMTVGFGPRVDHLKFRCKHCGSKRAKMRVMADFLAIIL